MTLTTRLELALKAAGVPVIGVNIPDPETRATWFVAPPELQAQAQPIIDAFVLVESPPRPVPAPGSYLGIVDADPESPHDGDLWIVREAFPTQRRQLRLRDGAVTRTLQTIVL